MRPFLWVLLILGFNLLVAYFISFYSFVVAVGWFCLATGFQFGKWYGGDEKEKEFIIREEAIRSEYGQKNKKI
jgi:hypothetical protein